MRTHQLRREIWLPRPLEEVFSFFSNAENLGVLTPPWVSFQILSERPIEMHAGTLIDYRIRVRGIPMRWQSEITVWEPMHRFVDEQRRGPYRFWHHEHIFERQGGGTLCRDIVHYAVLFDFVVHRFFVRADVEAIFAFREEKLRELFASPQDRADHA